MNHPACDVQLVTQCNLHVNIARSFMHLHFHRLFHCFLRPKWFRLNHLSSAIEQISMFSTEVCSILYKEFSSLIVVPKAVTKHLTDSYVKLSIDSQVIWWIFYVKSCRSQCSAQTLHTHQTWMYCTATAAPCACAGMDASADDTHAGAADAASAHH